MKITVQIENKNNSQFPNTLLKKFYQVFFFNSDESSIYIYTGIVLSAFGINPNFMFYFNFNSDINGKQFFHEDITDSFIKDTQGWVSIWGKNSKIFSGFDGLKEEYKALFSVNIPNNIIFKENIILIKDPINPDPKYTSIATNAKLICDNSSFRLNGYNNFYSNFDTINWVKSSIKLETKDFKDFEIKYEFINGNDGIECPDFKIYVILPNNDIIDTKKAAITQTSKEKNSVNTEIDRNPFQQMIIDEKKYFSDWINNRNILNSNVYKLIKPKDIQNWDKSFLVNFSIINPNIKEKSVLLLGFFISVLFAFGLDSTRINGKEELFSKILPPDINYLFTILLFIIFLIISPLYSTNKYNFKIKKLNLNYIQLAKIVNFILLMVWFLFLFVYTPVCIKNPFPLFGINLSIIKLLNIIILLFSLCINIFFMSKHWNITKKIIKKIFT